MAPVRGSAPRRVKTMHKTSSFAATNHPQHTATCCPNTSGQSASIELVAAPQVVVCRPHAVAAQPSRCSPERPHQCDRSAPPVQFSPRVSCRHKAYTTISLSPRNISPPISVSAQACSLFFPGSSARLTPRRGAQCGISILILLMKLCDRWHWVALDRHPVAPMQEV